MSIMKGIHWSVLIVAVFVVTSGCAKTRYVEFDDVEADTRLVGRVVEVEIDREYYENYPDCVVVMPPSAAPNLGSGISDLVESALRSAARAEEIGMGRDKIVLSCKTSDVQDLIAVYRDLAARDDYALHLGLTEAGLGSKGIVASTAALGILLQDGIGDTIRISLTPEPGGDRTREIIVAQEILQTMGLRSFTPMVIACPGCGRTTSTVFQDLAEKIPGHLRARMPAWKKR